MAKYPINILVCDGTGCHAAKGPAISENLQKHIEENNLNDTVKIVKTGCFGFCDKGPIVKIVPDNTFYVQVQPNDAKDIVEQHIIKGRRVNRLLHLDPSNKAIITDTKHMNFYTKQFRIALRNCGIIDPENIQEYIGLGGYNSLIRCVTELTPQEVIKIVKDSGLRGRGGGGFPTGLKWEITSKQVSDEKYVVCNADEGGPAAFTDRSIAEGDPHTIIEAMAICGYAINANKGIIFTRLEYPLAVKRLQLAINQARDHGLLGKGLFNTNFNFDIELRHGAALFVCGEESALINTMEGGRGEPHVKPPHPAVSGYQGKPTNVNNVESLANIPTIIEKGAAWFRSIGTEKSPGTKVLTLGGKINNVGFIEIPMGLTLRDIIYDIGGGVKGGKKFKAVQIGGPLGGYLTEEHLDMPLEYDTLLEAGSMIGSGAFVVLDEDDCMVSASKLSVGITVAESCGKCAPCRIGSKRLYETLDKICNGNGTREDLEIVENMGRVIKDTSLCGLGRSSANPVLSTLTYFWKEYEEHVIDKKCRSGACKNLMQYNINQDKCVGCTACARGCPVGAIAGERKSPHSINQDLCIKCGACMTKCKFNAIFIQ